jgi:hypothetical protein
MFKDFHFTENCAYFLRVWVYTSSGTLNFLVEVRLEYLLRLSPGHNVRADTYSYIPIDDVMHVTAEEGSRRQEGSEHAFFSLQAITVKLFSSEKAIISSE